MERQRTGEDLYRLLHLRNGIYHYKCRVPTDLAGLDSRAPHVRISLKTRDLDRAMAQRDLLEAADNELWASMMVDGETDYARQRYQAAVRRAAAIGFSYRTAADIAAEPIETIVRRIEAVMPPQTSPHVVAAVAGKIKNLTTGSPVRWNFILTKSQPTRCVLRVKSSAGAGRTSACNRSIPSQPGRRHPYARH